MRTIVGKGLFDHGDRDGTGDEVRLQHAEDLAVHGRTLIVADTYNGKLKSVSAWRTRPASRLPGEAGSGEALVHPAGIWADDDRIIVADTGQHRIVVVDLMTGRLAPFEIA